MYGNIYLQFFWILMGHVHKYTIHGCYGKNDERMTEMVLSFDTLQFLFSIWTVYTSQDSPMEALR